MKQDHQSNLETHNNLSHDKSQAVFNKELLIGKNYCFYSASGSSILSLANSKIRSEVCIGADRIYISITPKRFNKVPEILLQDISTVTVSTALNGYNTFWVVVTAIIGFFYPLFFVCPVLILLFFRHSKISIYQRNNTKAIIYSKNKKEAENFCNDIKQLAGIKAK